MAAFTPVAHAASPEAATHALHIVAARNDLRSLAGEAPDGDARIARIEEALATYESLAVGRTLGSNEPTSAINYEAEFEAALVERDGAGYLGTTPAETIRALADELRTARQPVLSPDISARIADGLTEITFCDGKYTFVLAEDTDYLIEIKRYGEAWSTNIVGPGRIVFGRAIGSLAGILAEACARAGAISR